MLCEEEGNLCAIICIGYREITQKDKANAQGALLCSAMELTLHTPLASCLQQATFFWMHSVHNGRAFFRNTMPLERLKYRSQWTILSRINKFQVLLGGLVVTQTLQSTTQQRGCSTGTAVGNTVYVIFFFLRTSPKDSQSQPTSPPRQSCLAVCQDTWVSDTPVLGMVTHSTCLSVLLYAPQK